MQHNKREGAALRATFFAKIASTSRLAYSLSCAGDKAGAFGEGADCCRITARELLETVGMP